jgi:hypothetical protein
MIKKAKLDLAKVKCFNCDNHGHLAKDFPKLLQINDDIFQGKFFFQGGFVVEIRVNKSETSNLLKLKCKINNKLVFCFLDLRATNSFMILQVVERLEVKIILLIDPIMVHLAQGISRPLFGVLVDVKMFCFRGVQVFENFTLCELNNFDVILRNTFLDVYEVDIFHNRSKVKIGFKFKKLDVEYNYALVKVAVNLVTLAKELKSPSFVILMSLRNSQWELKP